MYIDDENVKNLFDRNVIFRYKTLWKIFVIYFRIETNYTQKNFDEKSIEMKTQRCFSIIMNQWIFDFQFFLVIWCNIIWEVFENSYQKKRNILMSWKKKRSRNSRRIFFFSHESKSTTSKTRCFVVIWLLTHETNINEFAIRFDAIFDDLKIVTIVVETIVKIVEIFVEKSTKRRRSKLKIERRWTYFLRINNLFFSFRWYWRWQIHQFSTRFFVWFHSKFEIVLIHEYDTSHEFFVIQQHENENFLIHYRQQISHVRWLNHWQIVSHRCRRDKKNNLKINYQTTKKMFFEFDYLNRFVDKNDFIWRWNKIFIEFQHVFDFEFVDSNIFEMFAIDNRKNDKQNDFHDLLIEINKKRSKFREHRNCIWIVKKKKLWYNEKNKMHVWHQKKRIIVNWRRKHLKNQRNRTISFQLHFFLFDISSRRCRFFVWKRKIFVCLFWWIRFSRTFSHRHWKNEKKTIDEIEIATLNLTSNEWFFWRRRNVFDETWNHRKWHSIFWKIWHLTCWRLIVWRFFVWL